MIGIHGMTLVCACENHFKKKWYKQTYNRKVKNIYFQYKNNKPCNHTKFVPVLKNIFE